MIDYRELTQDTPQCHILVGPNGSGKSTLLYKIARDVSADGLQAIALSNTPFSAFEAGTDKRISVVNPFRRTLKRVAFETITQSLDFERDTNFHILRILDFLRFKPIIAFKIKQQSYRNFLASNPDAWRDAERREIIAGFLERSSGKDFVYDLTDSVSVRTRLADLHLFLETALETRLRDALTGTDIFLVDSQAQLIPMTRASSGQISLILTLFAVASRAKHTRAILIDEPENSLHPSWQRQYCELILGSVQRRDVDLFIATHSPMLVSGGLESNLDDIRVLRVSGGYTGTFATPISDRLSSSNIETILYDDFETLTPESRFLSELITDLINDVLNDKLTRSEFLLRINRFKLRSFSDDQKRFLDGTIELLDSLLRQMG